MTAAWVRTLAAIGLGSMVVSAQTAALKITSPTADSIVSGVIRLEAVVAPEQMLPSVQNVTFFVNGRLVCTVEQPPFGCSFNPGDVVRGHHVRVVATLTDGRRLLDNVRTKDLGYVEKVRTEAVLVPVIVRHNGEFVRGLKKQDFELFEDGVAQPIASFVNENAPLDLVLAVDISGSMENALPNVKAAVKQLLSKLRSGDAATLVGFNDTFFVAAEREKDQRTREEAVDLLTSWGGTALYDATVRALDMVSRELGTQGRRHLLRRGRSPQPHAPRDRDGPRAGQRRDVVHRGLWRGSHGARAAEQPRELRAIHGWARVFPRTVKELDGVFDEVVTELANQYVLSYSSSNLKTDSAWRNIKVLVRKGKYDVRARRGYPANGPQRGGR